MHFFLLRKKQWRKSCRLKSGSIVKRLRLLKLSNKICFTYIIHIRKTPIKSELSTRYMLVPFEQAQSVLWLAMHQLHVAFCQESGEAQFGEGYYLFWSNCVCSENAKGKWWNRCSSVPRSCGPKGLYDLLMSFVFLFECWVKRFSF